MELNQCHRQQNLGGETLGDMPPQSFMRGFSDLTKSHSCRRIIQGVCDHPISEESVTIMSLII